jgi:hypothetical protein
VAVDLHPHARRDLARPALLGDALLELLDVRDVHGVVHVRRGRDVLEPLDERRSRGASVLRAHVSGQRQRRDRRSRTDPRATHRHSPPSTVFACLATPPRLPRSFDASRPPDIR